MVDGPASFPWKTHFGGDPNGVLSLSTWPGSDASIGGEVCADDVSVLGVGSGPLFEDQGEQPARIVMSKAKAISTPDFSTEQFVMIGL
ncbi:MAG: hypothetical protein R2709_07205 [Marmoricola sp.]